MAQRYRLVQIPDPIHKHKWVVVLTETIAGKRYRKMTFMQPHWKLLPQVECESLDEILTPEDYVNWD